MEKNADGKYSYCFSVSKILKFHFTSVAQLCLVVIPWTEAHQVSLSITNSQSLLKLMSFKMVLIQPSHPLSAPSSPAFSLSQHLGFFQWVSSSHQVAKELELPMNISPSNNIQDWFPLELTYLISLLSRRLARVFSNTTVQKHQFYGTQLSLWSSRKNRSFDYTDLCRPSNVSAF